MPRTTIFLADISIQIKGKRKLYDWIKKVIISERKKPGEISIVFCSDDFLLDMNKKFLQHNYYTDIITFDYTVDGVISGELYISIDRVKDNAEQHNESFDNELRRVIIHGVLHLCGYKDKTKEDQAKMRSKEDQKLKLITV